MSAKMSDFQKSFLSRGGMTVYTQTEFNEQLAKAQAQIMQVAIDTTKTAIAIERESAPRLLMRCARGSRGWTRRWF